MLILGLLYQSQTGTQQHIWGTCFSHILQSFRCLVRDLVDKFLDCMLLRQAARYVQPNVLHSAREGMVYLKLCHRLCELWGLHQGLGLLQLLLHFWLLHLLCHSFHLCLHLCTEHQDVKHNLL